MNKEKITSNIIDLINYFQSLANNREEQNGGRIFEWYLGLFLSKRLLCIVESENPSVEELNLLVKVLEAGDLGSGSVDLLWQARNFLSLAENPQAVEEIRNIAER